MPNTRSSTRKSASPQPEKSASPVDATGTKRKAGSSASPASKRGRKELKRLDETMPGKIDDDAPNDLEMQEAGDAIEGGDVAKPADDANATAPKEEKDETQDGAKDRTNGEKARAHKDEEHNTASEPATGENGAIEKSPDKKLPSNILEKGIIYFFTRGRVGIEEPESVQDLQRTYFVLRPLPADAKLGEGVIQDLKNNRLFAVPKKVLPKSHKDRFMVFVEKANSTIEDLKENFMRGSEYKTKTAGTRHNPPVAPVGEGVYAITTQDNATSHMAYMLTIPSEIGDVQTDMGLRSKGSFIFSLKNPTRKGPANAILREAPDFPQDIIDEFRGRAWMPPSSSKQLDYPNAQFLLIGEGEAGFDKATGAASKDKKADTEAPAEELEELENADEIRVEHLHGDDTVFDDLGISHKDYPKVMTTW